jgi:hypothetical protein
MITVLSLVTSVKDYIEIAHKLIETQNSADFGTNSNQGFFGLTDYTELGAVLTYVILSISTAWKGFLTSFFSFSWLKNIWSLPLVVPDIASAMISEISVFDSYFTNTFSFLESGLSSSNLQSLASENTLNVTSGASPFVYGFEKFMIGFFNSFFLFLPTSTAHLITLRRFVMQGLEAGYIAGLGTIAGNFLWLASIILGLRFIVIPWLSLDIFRYVLGFVLLVKYLWDSSKEFRGSAQNKTSNRTALEANTKTNIFLLNFLLALTEQTSIYPFISNISFGAEGSILEGFSATSSIAGDSSFQFLAIHGLYLLGILLGSFSLLQFTVWFWENPAFSIYMWMISSYRVTTSSYYKVLNFGFLYLTMLCAISSIPYFGLDYTVTNPLGLIPQDRIIDQKKSTLNGPGEFILPETSFLGMNPTDKNSRIRDGIHARRERWKERLIKYQAFDASLYDQGSYDILTIEDLNYGFDRFWLRRKLRNHQIRFRLFPGPWMRSLKKQLNKPGFTGPRVEFFRILFEQYYHPSFHATTSKKKLDTKSKKPTQATSSNIAQPTSAIKPTSDLSLFGLGSRNVTSLESQSASTTNANVRYANPNTNLFIASGAFNKEFLETKNKDKTLVFKTQKGLINQYSALRKFSRNFSNRINSSYISSQRLDALLVSATNSVSQPKSDFTQGTDRFNVIYSKSLKSLFNQIHKEYPREKLNIFRNLSKQFLTKNVNSLQVHLFKTPVWQQQNSSQNNAHSDLFIKNQSLKKTNIRKKLSKKEKILLNLKTDMYKPGLTNTLGINVQSLKPLDFFLQKEDAFKRKLKYYSTTVTRKLSVGNNAPFFKTMLKRAFYYHKPSLRWKRTMFTAAMRRGFRKKATYPKKIVYTKELTTGLSSEAQIGNVGTSLAQVEKGYGQSPPLTDKSTLIYPSTTSYSVLGKRASRYRYQIYKDVLQHWYYTPFNRLLLKFDVDSFINRQPKAHFLTKKEERLLHLRRILLSEHYNTLRWYTYMQHYRTMKSRIGGTKSFANTVYNQQFQGTFKKIRHLFSITPSQGDMTVLKFDQPLYNDLNISYGGNISKKALPVGASYLHEGLSINPSLPIDKQSLTGMPSENQKETVKKQDFIEQSLEVAGLYLQTEQQEYSSKIKEYIKQQNYSGLTSLLANKDNIQSNSPNNIGTGGQNQNINNQSSELLLLQLLKECKRRLNDQTFIKNYISHRLDKRRFAASKEISATNKTVNDQLDNYNTNLESFKAWLSPIILEKQRLSTLTNKSLSLSLSLRGGGNNASFDFATRTTGLRKALNNGVLATQTADGTSVKLPANQSTINFSVSEDAQIQQTLKTIQSLKESLNTNKKVNSLAKQNIKTQISKLYKQILNQVIQPLLKISTLQYKLLTKRTEKNLEWWRQKQRSITKRKSSRKKSRFKGIQDVQKVKNQQKALTEQNQDRSNSVLSTAFQNANKAIDTVLQKKAWLRRENIVENYAFDMESKTNAGLQSSLSSNPTATLRKKVDSDSFEKAKTKGIASDSAYDSGRLPKLLQKLFVKKFRKKRSAKDRHYRNMVMNRGFAQIHKPKNTNSYLSIQDPYGAETLQSGKAPPKLIDSTLDKKEVLKQFKTYLSKEKQEADNTWIVGSAEPIKPSTSVLNGRNTLETEVKDSQTTTDKLKNLLKQGYIKKSPAKKRSKRTWKRRKRAKFTKNHFKYRKRDVYSFGKLRALTKKIKRIESIQEFQNWWWNNYLPNFIRNRVAPSQNNPELSYGLSQAAQKSKSEKPFIKPLATPKALDIRQTLSLRDLDVQSASTKQNPSIIGQSNSLLEKNELSRDSAPINVKVHSADTDIISNQSNQQNVLDQIYENLFTTSLESKVTAESYKHMFTPNSNSEAINRRDGRKPSMSTNIPFYAGWDESLRKFVVTNRLLTRREAGSEVSLNQIFEASTLPNNNPTADLLNTKNTRSASFTNAPIQGLNEGTFLYLQTQAPLAFNAYAIDQFVPNNQSFYAPLGWKRFQFRHSILKNWLNNKQQTTSLYDSNQKQLSKESLSNPIAIQKASLSNFQYFKNYSLNGTSSNSFTSSAELYNKKTKLSSALQNRRIKKRYKLLKQTPIQLMYVPTGTLLTEILPSHYISVFDKQYRFPRNRYLKRNLPKANSTNVSQKTIKDLTILETSRFMDKQTSASLSGSQNIETVYGSALDFTLRKRVKPRRKYHKKRFTKKEGLIFPRRRKFGTTLSLPTANSISQKNVTVDNSENLFRLRPSIKAKQTTMSKSKTQKRAGQPKANPVRLRQLRRREFQQVFKPLQRFQPRSGGFVWPGDYLRLEVVPMPKLQVTSPDTYSKATAASVTGTTGAPTVINKVKRKINVQPVGLLPRKYLIQKHNLKVLKKKMALSLALRT